MRGLARIARKGDAGAVEAVYAQAFCTSQRQSQSCTASCTAAPSRGFVHPRPRVVFVFVRSARLKHRLWTVRRDAVLAVAQIAERGPPKPALRFPSLLCHR